jgi:carbon-monoxide dehydrogenase small subunit
MRIHVIVNGTDRDVDVADSTTLLDFVRDDLHLTGTKECCDLGECGACTLLVEGRAVNSCLMLAAEVEGGEITTIEGLSEKGKLSPLQDAFLAKGAVQCGFCIPGQVMAAHHLLRRNPHPTLDEVKEGLSGNLCRCGAYVQICEAVLAASEES